MFNHESMFDVLMLAGGIPYYINAIGWEGVFKIPLFGFFAKRYGAYAITHDSTDKAKQTLKLAERILRCMDGMGRKKFCIYFIVLNKQGQIQVYLNSSVPIWFPYST